MDEITRAQLSVDITGRNDYATCSEAVSLALTGIAWHANALRAWTAPGYGRGAYHAFW
jgi:hypothetical protein